MDASQQFWMSEDLLEQLLPMLDLPTIVALASTNPLAVSLLSRPPLWRQFLFRLTQHGEMCIIWSEACPRSFPNCDVEDSTSVYKHKTPMIADILEMMECQESRLLEFVDHISQAFPVDEDDEGRFPYGGKIKLAS